MTPNVKNNNRSINERIVKMETDISYLKKRVDELTDKIEELKAYILKRNGNYAGMNVKVDVIEEHLNKIEEKIDIISSKIPALEQRIQENERKISIHDKLIITMVGGLISLIAAIIAQLLH